MESFLVGRVCSMHASLALKVYSHRTREVAWREVAERGNKLRLI
jgi:hypothetical protein